MNKSQLEALEAKGPEIVLLEIAQGGHGSYDSPTRREVEAWLQSKTLSKRDAREEETLTIAKEANVLAQEANTIARDDADSACRSARWAKIAAIIAAAAAIIANRADIMWSIKYLLNQITKTP
jgi:hypothetical protein